MLRPSLVLFGTAVALVGGGVAFAGWTSRSTSVTFTVTAAKIPQVPRPTVTLAVVPIVSWRRVRIAADTPVERYVVTRHAGRATRVVCTQPATSWTRCVDFTAPLGSALTYTVRATHGKYWTGVDSEASIPLGTPGAPLGLDASGVPVVPSTGPATPTVTVPPVDGVNPLLVETTPPAGPTTSVGLVEPTTEPPVTDAPVTPQTEAPTESGLLPSVASP
jgi:hypothetical protein